jgi:hypothetical protein
MNDIGIHYIRFIYLDQAVKSKSVSDWENWILICIEIPAPKALYFNNPGPTARGYHVIHLLTAPKVLNAYPADSAIRTPDR